MSILHHPVAEGIYLISVAGMPTSVFNTTDIKLPPVELTEDIDESIAAIRNVIAQLYV